MKFQSFKVCGLVFAFLMSSAFIGISGSAFASQKIPVSFNDYHGYTNTVKYIKDVALAMGLRIADKTLIVSRFKGHDGAGFGGALKQLGIGCVGNEGKGGAHWGGGENIYVKRPENCTACGKCIRICPTQALSLDENQKIVHDPGKCLRVQCASRCAILGFLLRS